MDYPIFLGSYFFKDNIPIHTEMTEEPPYLMRHQHDCIEVAYVLEGEGLHYIGESILHVFQGDLFLIPAYVSHVFQPKELAGRQSSLRIINCLFDSNLLDAATSSNLNRWRVYHEQACEFREVLVRMYVEQQNQTESINERIKLQKQLMALLRAKQEKSDLLHVEGGEVPIHQAVQHMGLRFANPLSLPEMSRLVSLSTRHFQRLFKSATGRSYMQLLQEIRMRHSCGMLQYTSWSVQAIAQRVGIYDMNYFYRLFREHCGTTPAAFRLNNKHLLAFDKMA
jgi:AraC family L-rhamnose operon transcriptional activator RhaR